MNLTVISLNLITIGDTFLILESKLFFFVGGGGGGLGKRSYLGLCWPFLSQNLFLFLGLS